MVLRREVDRSLKDVRVQVGSQPPPVVQVPDYLADLRTVLVNGRTADAIEALKRPEYERDALAQLLLAGCLLFEHHVEEAVTVYERVAEASEEHRHAALVGKATALLELDRAQDALDLLDQRGIDHPDDVEVIEGRARALERLGRTDEAAAEHRRLVALSSDRSHARLPSVSA